VTYATRLAGRRHRVALFVTIQGIPYAFKEVPGISASTIIGDTRTELSILKDVEEEDRKLDYNKRAVLGGGLSFSLQDPRGSSSLQSLFAPRLRRKTYINTNATTSATTIVTDSTTALASAGTVYVGGETITYTSKTATDLQGCTRGAFGSIAQEHFTATETGAEYGASIFTQPPAWKGRRVNLYAVFLNEDGTANSNSQQVGCYSIEQSPSYSEGAWHFQCGPIIDEYLSRKVGLGLKDMAYTSITYDPATFWYTVNMENTDNLGADHPMVSTLMIDVVDTNGETMTETMRIVDGSTSAVTCVRDEVIQFVPHPSWSIATQSGGSARHVCVLSGTSPQSLKPLLVSIEGGGTNSAADILPGVDRTSLTGQSWRFGAGIPSSYIDSSWGTVAAQFPFSYFIRDTIELAKLLTSFCLGAGCYVYTTNTGKLAIKRISDEYVASSSITTTIDSSSIVAGSDSVEYNEDMIAPVLSVSANYDPRDGDSRLTVNITDRELLARYPERTDPVELELLGCYVAGAPARSTDKQQLLPPAGYFFEEFETQARRWQSTDGRGMVIVRLRCKHTMAALNVGDLVNITRSSLPDFESTTGIGGSTSTAEVIERGIDWDTGEVRLALRMRQRVFCIVPFVVGHSRSTTSVANDTITVLGTDDGEGATSDFFVGQIVKAWQLDGTAVETYTIAAITSTTLQFTTGVATFTADATWFTWGDVGTNADTVTTSGISEPDLAFNVSQTETIADGAIRRWQ